LNKSLFQVLVVDDYEPWRSFASKTLHQKPQLQVVSEASDGLEAVHKAERLQPDLILLDIGLPTINGIEAARRILQHAPKTKILFVSEQRSPEIVNKALRMGAQGYVVKSKAATELLAAVEAVLQGKQFLSASLTVALSNTTRRHEVGFYSDDQRLLEDVTQFIAAALKAGSAAVVIATESHRNNLLPRLQAQGVEIDGAIAQGRYIALDVKDALSTFMVDATLNPVRFMEAFGNLIVTAAKAANTEHRRVAVFGEGTHLLWTQGHVDAAIQDEELCNELTKRYEVDILCGYSVGSVQGEMDSHLFQKICAEHSVVHSR